MLIRASLILAGAVLASPATAQRADERIRSLFYDPAAIVTIHGRPNVESTIIFGPDERIENVAVGDSAAWQVTPNKRADVLFLKPQAPRGRTNLTVVTDRRTYLFDLVAGANRAPALYTLRFTYPAPPPPQSEPAKPVQVVAASPPPKSLALNFNWSEKGARRLLPQRLFDDGSSVYLAWAAGVPMPAMLSVAPDGTEGPVNYTVQGEFVVVDGLPGRIVLRTGKEMAVLDRDPKTAAATSSLPLQTAER